MTKSILYNPPKGSALAALVTQLKANEGPPPDFWPPEALAIIDANALEHDGRLYKHTSNRIARAVIAMAAAEFGEEAALALARHPAMARHYAATIQALEEANATPAERAAEPPPETPHLVKTVMMAELLRVMQANPDASINRLCELAGANLKGSARRIDRNTIRRHGWPALVRALSSDVAPAALRALEALPQLLKKWPPLKRAG